MAHDFVFRFVMLGETCVGKTTMILTLTGEEASNARAIATISMDFYTQNVTTIDGQTIKLQVWDAPGLKRLRTTVRSSYKSIAAALLVYDVTNRESFESLRDWIRELREECPNEDVILMLIGNKKDLESQRMVSDEEARRFILEENLHGYAEVSAFDRDCVEDVFHYLAGRISRMLDRKSINASRSSGISGSLFPGSRHSPRTRTVSQISLASQCEVNSASSTPDFFQGRSFRQSWSSRSFTRFGSFVATNSPLIRQSPNESSIGGRLNSVVSGMRKAGSLSSIMDKFWTPRSESRKVSRTDAEGEDAKPSERSSDKPIIETDNKIAGQDKPQQRNLRGSPSLLRISEARESDHEQANSMTLPKPKRKLFSGKLPSFRNMSNSLRRKSGKESRVERETEVGGVEGGESDDSLFGKEMTQDQPKVLFSPFEYADEASTVTPTKGDQNRHSLIEISPEHEEVCSPRRSISLVEFDAKGNVLDISGYGRPPKAMVECDSAGTIDRYTSDEFSIEVDNNSEIEDVSSAIDFSTFQNNHAGMISKDENSDSGALQKIQGDRMQGSPILHTNPSCIDACVTPNIHNDEMRESASMSADQTYAHSMTQQTKENIDNKTDQHTIGNHKEGYEIVNQPHDRDTNEDVRATTDICTENTDEIRPSLTPGNWQECQENAEPKDDVPTDLVEPSNSLNITENALVTSKTDKPDVFQYTEIKGPAIVHTTTFGEDLSQPEGASIPTEKSSSVTQDGSAGIPTSQSDLTDTVESVPCQINNSTYNTSGQDMPTTKERGTEVIDQSMRPEDSDLLDAVRKALTDNGPNSTRETLSETKSHAESDISAPDLSEASEESPGGPTSRDGNLEIRDEVSGLVDAVPGARAIPSVVKPIPQYSTYSFNTRYHSHFNKYRDYRRINSTPSQNGHHINSNYLDMYHRTSFQPSPHIYGANISNRRTSSWFSSPTPYYLPATRSVSTSAASSAIGSAFNSPTSAYLSGYEKGKRFSMELKTRDETEVTETNPV